MPIDKEHFCTENCTVHNLHMNIGFAHWNILYIGLILCCTKMETVTIYSNKLLDLQWTCVSVHLNSKQPGNRRNYPVSSQNFNGFFSYATITQDILPRNNSNWNCTRITRSIFITFLSPLNYDSTLGSVRCSCRGSSLASLAPTLK